MGRKIIRTSDDIPKHFDSEEAEAEFWETHELSHEYWQAHRLPRGQAPYPALQALRDERAAAEAAKRAAAEAGTNHERG